MKIVFIGTVEFSKKALQKLIKLNAQIVGVGSKAKSIFNSDFADLAPLCEENKIPFKYIEDINEEENINWIKSLNPDVIFCFGWSNIIKKKILTLPPMGVLGYHPTKLPKNRGRHPLIWALALGLRKSASTFFFMDEGVDSGKILCQKDFDILPSDNARKLYNKVVNIALLQIENFLPKLNNKTFHLVEQNNEKSNLWRKRSHADGRIDFRMTSKAIYDLVRALSEPYIGAHINYKNKDIIIWDVNIVENYDANIEHGKVIDVQDGKILVKTYDSAIEISRHQFKEIPKIGEYL